MDVQPLLGGLQWPSSEPAGVGQVGPIRLSVLTCLSEHALCFPLMQGCPRQLSGGVRMTWLSCYARTGPLTVQSAAAGVSSVQGLGQLSWGLTPSVVSWESGEPAGATTLQSWSALCPRTKLVLTMGGVWSSPFQAVGILFSFVGWTLV